MSDPNEVVRTIVDRVVVVDDLTNNEKTLENTTGFNEEGKIISYESKEIVDEEEEEEEIDDNEEDFGSEDDEEEESDEDEDDDLVSSVEKDNMSMEEALTELGEVAVEDNDIVITTEDIRNSFETSMFNEDKKYMLSDSDILTLLNIVDKVKQKEDVNIYANLPQSVKDIINKYMLDQGVQGYSVQANSIRNMLAETLIEEFITNISINKTVDSFNKEMEDLFDKTGEEFSKMYKEYDTERTKYLQAALDKIPEGDPRRVTVTNVLDSINDAYSLNRLKAATSKLKIKNFDREKPEKIFSDFEYKYKNKPYKIYPLKTVLGVLHKHLIEAIKPTLPEEMSDEDKLARADVIAAVEAVDFIILFCKFCMNYRVDVPDQHAFMYYTLYNIMLLDVYKGDEYMEFAKGFIHNIIESYKPYYKKTMSEENFNKRFN